MRGVLMFMATLQIALERAQIVPVARVNVRYYVIEYVGGRRVATRYRDRRAALLYSAARGGKVDCNYGFGPVRIK